MVMGDQIWRSYQGDKHCLTASVSAFQIQSYWDAVVESGRVYIHCFLVLSDSGLSAFQVQSYWHAVVELVGYKYTVFWC